MTALAEVRAGTDWLLNLNFVCNERCVFCAAELADGPAPVASRPRGVTLDDVAEWTAPEPPGPADRVLLAGGEPTLHPHVFEIASLLGADGAEVVLITNGLRLARAEHARAAVDAGIRRFEIALFGADAEHHEAVTRVRGSFEKTLAALAQIDAARRARDVTIEVRLLVSRQSSAQNPEIVSLLARRAPFVDVLSLNRLILSDDAREADATIGWDEARPHVAEAVARARVCGKPILLGGLPHCVVPRGEEPEPGRPLWRKRYLDPLVAAGESDSVPPRVRALPDVCLPCARREICGRVERWYLQRYGTRGLATLNA